MRVPVRLRSPDLAYNVFLDDHQITVAGDDVSPLTYRGRVFVFLHKMQIGSYQQGAHQEAYVFEDSGPIAETTMP